MTLSHINDLIDMAACLAYPSYHPSSRVGQCYKVIVRETQQIVRDIESSIFASLLYLASLMARWQRSCDKDHACRESILINTTTPDQKCQMDTATLAGHEGKQDQEEIPRKPLIQVST